MWSHEGTHSTPRHLQFGNLLDIDQNIARRECPLRPTAPAVVTAVQAALLSQLPAKRILFAFEFERYSKEAFGFFGLP
jgi:hypothetical protein